MLRSSPRFTSTDTLCSKQEQWYVMSRRWLELGKGVDRAGYDIATIVRGQDLHAAEAAAAEALQHRRQQRRGLHQERAACRCCPLQPHRLQSAHVDQGSARELLIFNSS